MERAVRLQCKWVGSCVKSSRRGERQRPASAAHRAGRADPPGEHRGDGPRDEGDGTRSALPGGAGTVPECGGDRPGGRSRRRPARGPGRRLRGRSAHWLRPRARHHGADAAHRVAGHRCARGRTPRGLRRPWRRRSQCCSAASGPGSPTPRSTGATPSYAFLPLRGSAPSTSPPRCRSWPTRCVSRPVAQAWSRLTRRPRPRPRTSSKGSTGTSRRPWSGSATSTRLRRSCSCDGCDGCSAERGPDRAEINILRGILTAATRASAGASSEREVPAPGTSQSGDERDDDASG